MSARSDQYEDEPHRAEGERYDVDEYGFERDHWETGEERGWWRFWDEGVITLLVVGGAVLFLLPEPMTSAIGVLMLGAGVLLWLVDWMT